MVLSSLITPILIASLLIYCAIKRINCYATFCGGVKNGLSLCLELFPFIITIFVAISLFRISGLCNIVSNLCAPILSLVGIPPELCELIIIRPFSGSGSLSIYENLLSTYGADSYISRCASVIMGSSETVFYVATIYFAQTKVKRLLYAIPVGLIATYTGTILSCWLCRIM